MATREEIIEKVEREHINPIYQIVVFEHPNKEYISKNGKHLGWPDEGAMNTVGFYYNLDVAIDAMHTNCCDIQERLYQAGFILCHREGLYNAAGRNDRIYFAWDEDRQGFFEAEEPVIFSHIAY